ncbi:sulfatase-like hydrolase/transferase [Telluribacter sp. SYSU D00476]|uniref:sulfatase-like hydrolase/transferase n=1 Tax=Telluribacter sp. SYSU D00476 TaxID=2811430 RepID=UPI001FF40698|nr:sulfatase-like hydrolase/transferase [Telluribacter sp. SYSU D00476]
MREPLKHTGKILVGVLVPAIAVVCVTFIGAVPARAPAPNILLILTDDQGYHDVSYYGTKDLRTPNLDQLTRDGMRFDNFYANSTVCSPTRASLLSGRYPDYVGVPGVIRTYDEDSWGYLDPKARLLPAMLRKAGYHTALIGKWHLGLEAPNTPNEHGFDYFHGWLGDMMDDYWTHRRHGVNYMRKDRQTIDPQGHATDLFTQWSVEYIKKQQKDKSPFFLYLAYNAPHFPVQPPKEWLQKVKQREPDLPEKRAELVAFIEHMDESIGQVIWALRETGQYENTLIIFTSDNGGHLPSLANNGPARDGKQSMYEGGLRVPTSITWPGRIKAGSVSDQVNLSMDIYPTLLEVAGSKATHQVEGRSFLKTLLGETMDEAERPLYFTRREGGTDYAGQCIYALRLGDWKLLQNKPYEPMELYNLKSDPLEKKNVLKEQPEIYKKLNKLLMLHIQKAGKVPWQQPDGPVVN